MKKTAAKTTRARSGFVTEEKRKTERLTLRLKPETMALLYSLSTEIAPGGGPKTYAETVEQALQALNREMQVESDANE